MATTPAAKAKAPLSPSPLMILMAYVILGLTISFAFGRRPGTLPENLLMELAPVFIVVCSFLVSYSLWDVMAVGVAKQKTGYSECAHEALPVRLPEEVWLAQRVQTNQVEQLPIFFVGSFGCALLVDGVVAVVMALFWAILRRQYASLYRSSVGVKVSDIGLQKYTIPAYFLCNVMCTATIIHSLRALLLANNIICT